MIRYKDRLSLSTKDKREVRIYLENRSARDRKSFVEVGYLECGFDNDGDDSKAFCDDNNTRRLSTSLLEILGLLRECFFLSSATLHYDLCGAMYYQ